MRNKDYSIENSLLYSPDFKKSKPLKLSPYQNLSSNESNTLPDRHNLEEMTLMLMSVSDEHFIDKNSDESASQDDNSTNPSL